MNDSVLAAAEDLTEEQEQPATEAEQQTQQTDQAPAPNEDAPAPERRKFADKYETVEDLERGYKELQSAFSKAQAQVPDDYQVPKVAAPDSPDENLEINTEDPTYRRFAISARKHKITQEQFDGLIGDYLHAQLQTAKEAREHDMQSLGSEADARVQKVSTWLKGQLGSEAYEANRDAFTGAKHVLVLEMLMAKGPATARTTTEAPKPSVVSEEEIGKMMQSDEYRQSASFREKVQDMQRDRIRSMRSQ